MKCWNCGKQEGTIKFENYTTLETGAKFSIENSGQRMYCKDCWDKVMFQRERDKLEYVRLKKKLMLERSLRILEKQNVDMYEYKDVVEVVEKAIETKPEMFDSSHEIISAIILLDNEIEIKTQYKIGKYKVDFYIPSLKVIFEVDGERHKYSAYTDSKRDDEIRKILGAEWEVVRIGTDYIEQNAELLVEAIKAIKNEKQKIRKENYGILPEWWSKREKAKRSKTVIAGDDFLLEN